MPELQETRVQSPGQEDPLEKEMATHAGVLAWGILWGPWGLKESDRTEQLDMRAGLYTLRVTWSFWS